MKTACAYFACILLLYATDLSFGDSVVANESGENDDERQGVRIETNEIVPAKKRRDGISAVDKTIEAGSSEGCDWKSNPVAFLKGEVCGAHYKVLGIKRKGDLADKALIRKKYRQMSLSLHPDKNTDDSADEAFNYLQQAYNCITNDSCRANYNEKLNEMETSIALRRDEFKNEVVARTSEFAIDAHYYISIAANRIYEACLRIWEMVGEWNVNMFGVPLAQPVVGVFLMLKARPLLWTFLASYLILNFNAHLARTHGWSNEKGDII